MLTLFFQMKLPFIFSNQHTHSIWLSSATTSTGLSLSSFIRIRSSICRPASNNPFSSHAEVLSIRGNRKENEDKGMRPYYLRNKFNLR